MDLQRQTCPNSNPCDYKKVKTQDLRSCCTMHRDVTVFSGTAVCEPALSEQ